MARERILVVEDEVIVGRDIEQRLHSLGYQVPAVVTSGEEALLQVAEVSPDLLLMDIRLQGAMDGIETAEKVRDFFDKPVVYLTAHADEDILRRVTATAPFGYVLKPFSERELHLAIEVALCRHKMERRLRESEERYALAARVGRICVWDYLPHDGLLISPSLFAFLGYDDGELGADRDDWKKVVYPEDLASVEGLLHAFRRPARRRSVEHRVVTRRGNVRWALSTGEAVRDANGRLVRVIGTSVDITERRRMEARMRRERDFAESLIDTAQAIVLLLDKRGAILRFNAYMEEVSGYRCDQMRGRDWLDVFLHDRDRARVRGLLQKAVAGAPTLGFNVSIVTRDGREREIEWHEKPLRDPQGGVIGLLCVGQDVTERRRYEEALRRSEQQLRIVTDFTHDWEYWLDPDGRLLYISPSCERVTGYPREDFIEQPELLASIVHPDDRELFKTHIEDSHDARVEDSLDFRIVARDGSLRWLNHVCRAVFDEQGRYLGRRGSNRDITDRKHAEEERMRLDVRMQQTQRLESLGVLAGGIAHDFNNLLMGILGNADLALMDAPGDTPLRQTLTEIIAAARRAAELTQQMLAYSGQGRFVIERVDLAVVVSGMESLLQAALSKNARLVIEPARDAAFVEVDAGQLRQVIMNLVANAGEALGQDGGSVVVRTGTMPVTEDILRAACVHDELPLGHYAYLRVSDTGCGMDPETAARAFEPFFSTKFTGRGLGLAAVLGIVRGHRGAICLESRPGDGTIVTVLLPMADPSSLNGPRGDELVFHGSGTVLLVDDEQVIREVATRMLERVGFEVLAAGATDEALALYRDRRSDIVCVILDATMPGMIEGDMFRQLRAVDPDVRMVLTSGYAREDLEARHGDDLPRHFLQKPYGFSALLAAIRETVEAR